MRWLALIPLLLVFAPMAVAQLSSSSSSGSKSSAKAALPPAAAGPVALEVETDRRFYPANVPHKVYLEMKLAGQGGVDGATRPAAIRNVALVIDRSGSMAGERWQAVREATTAALALFGEQDFVSVVLFGSEVETILEAQPRGSVENLDPLLARVEPAGGSALYDALNQGAAQLRRRAGPATSNHLILITDGPPTKGPREPADFARLGAALAEERITVSAVGLGAEFNEDMLTGLARAASGSFRYADQPAKLAEAMLAMLATPGALVARDLTLTVELLSPQRDLETYGWMRGVVADNKVTYRLPYLFAGQRIPLFLGAEMDWRRSSYRFARLRLSWTGVADGRPGESERMVELRLEDNLSGLRDNANPAVVRTAVAIVISDGLQQAIEELDQGDARRALRALRRARSEAVALNYGVDEPAAAAAIAQLDRYLAEVRSRGLNELDRKVLRSGLFNQFDIPVADDDKER